MQKLILSVLLFLAVCAAGVVIMLAGGVQWGTTDCGVLAAFTLLGAALSVLMYNDPRI